MGKDNPFINIYYSILNSTSLFKIILRCITTLSNNEFNLLTDMLNPSILLYTPSLKYYTNHGTLECLTLFDVINKIFIYCKMSSEYVDISIITPFDADPYNESSLKLEETIQYVIFNVDVFNLHYIEHNFVNVYIVSLNLY